MFFWSCGCCTLFVESENFWKAGFYGYPFTNFAAHSVFSAIRFLSEALERVFIVFLSMSKVHVVLLCMSIMPPVNLCSVDAANCDRSRP